MTPAELKKRRKFLGGSEIAAVRGHSPFTTAAQLWDEKMGRAEPKESSFAMNVGIYLEDGAAKLFHSQKYTNCKMKKHKPLVHQQYGFMRASPDRILYDMEEHPEDGHELWYPCAGLEIKCISDFSAKAGGWGRSGSQDYPIYYKDQCAWNRMIFDLPVWNLIALVADGKWSLKCYVYKKDEAYEAELIRDALNFWNNNILAGVRPEEKPVHRLTSPDAQDIVSAKLPAIAPAWMTEENQTPNATV